MLRGFSFLKEEYRVKSLLLTDTNREYIFSSEGNFLGKKNGDL